jgi:N-acetylmuramoyl-L-alanine amidase
MKFPPCSSIATATLAAATAIAGLLNATPPATATAFGQYEVEQSKFVAAAAPIQGGSAHQLLILEQVSSARPCWSELGAAPVQIDPLLTTFNFTGVCGRSTDSNGYSIRMNGADLAMTHSLRVLQRSGDLVLVGIPKDRTQPELLIGRANGTTSQFAKLNLEPGWRFTKRTFDGKLLGHVYLTYGAGAPVNPGSGGGQPVPAPVRFTDTASDVYRQEIATAVGRGFVAGFEDNTFRPQASLTREQLVSMVVDSLVKLPPYSGPQTTPVLAVPGQVTTNPFQDVTAARWSAAKIQVARDLRIVGGYQDGTFRPNQPVTRAELVVILQKAAAFGQMMQGGNPTLVATQPGRSFSDTGKHWANQGINTMAGYCGVASALNETGTEFKPDTAAQRNYAAAATLRMLNCVSRSAPKTAAQ